VREKKFARMGTKKKVQIRMGGGNPLNFFAKEDFNALRLEGVKNAGFRPLRTFLTQAGRRPGA
jgi:hypothetical protein